jgi:hypothetical protein
MTVMQRDAICEPKSVPTLAERALLMTVRQALLMIVSGIETYLGIANKR